MKRIGILFYFLLSIGILNAQDDFEGTIISKIEYENLNEQMEAMKSLLPSSSTTQVKDGISKSVTPDGMGGETIMITNFETGESMTLQSSMGNKIAVTTTKEDLEKQQEGMEIEKTDETKEILGYKCKKVIITVNEIETEVYYTTELPNVSSNIPNEIDGFPLQTILTLEAFTVVSTVTEIKKEKVKKIKMEAPSDFKVITFEEAQKMQGGM